MGKFKFLLLGVLVLLLIVMLIAERAYHKDKFLFGDCVSNIHGDIFRIDGIESEHYVARLLATRDVSLRENLKWSNFKHFPKKKDFEAHFTKMKKCPDVYIIGGYDDNKTNATDFTISASIPVGPTAGYVGGGSRK